jgi:hypothetical protein
MRSLARIAHKCPRLHALAYSALDGGADLWLGFVGLFKLGPEPSTAPAKGWKGMAAERYHSVDCGPHAKKALVWLVKRRYEGRDKVSYVVLERADDPTITKTLAASVLADPARYRSIDELPAPGPRLPLVFGRAGMAGS